ncbi:MAG: methyl-accepting chemotaxis protein [Oscillospiraceae bacterium]|nr:methyl-accepting chemotaxis protein [Oscillospiraceae bacterium]
MGIKSLGLKISILVAVVIAALVVTISLIVQSETDSLIADLVSTQAETSNNILIQTVENLKSEAFNTARIISRSYTVIDAIQDNDLNSMKEALVAYGDNVDAVTLVDANGIVLMRSHNDVTGDNVRNQPALAAALSTGEGVAIIERAAGGGLFTQGSAAIYSHEGVLLGAVTAGHDLSSNEYVDEVKELGDCEVTIFDGRVRMSTTIIGADGNRVIGTEIGEAIGNSVLNQQQKVTARIELFGHTYQAFYSPLIVDNEAIGILFTGINIEPSLTAQRDKINLILTVAIIIGVAAVVFIFVICIFMISRPLKKIGIFANKIRSGDLGISSASDSSIAVRSKDEVGMMARTLEQAYTQLQGYIGEIRAKMEALASGDLSQESTYQFEGDFILIKEAINGIVENLNETMSEINTSTVQVASGSKQIADGAQALAQGSTEQAASVEQLSASISDIAQKTKDNAEKASRAATLASSIMQNAEKGSRQMGEMTNAVKEINQASQSISKVIKVIDDIAFQTNILALNAAVEAARAGQHGKGFAVVAEEVRNLAGKSAEAAKDTGGLISNSMEKAELGARIAEETATSLADIVAGISESTQLVGEIATSSEEQSTGITQVNTGIDQVAQVVQQNSATAEESAAASEEMSGQSSVLENLISQFKLKNDAGNRRQALPSANKAPVQQTEIPQIDSTPDYSGGSDFGKY